MRRLFMLSGEKLITVAIHTYEKALILKTLLEREGIEVVIHNVNLIQPVVSSGVRVRIHERDLPMALQIIESATDAGESHKIYNEKDKLLIPVDFSECSMKACALGFDFAYRVRADVNILYAYINSAHSGILPFKSDEYDEDTHIYDDGEVERIANGKMDEFAKLVKKEITNGALQNVKFTTIVTEGIPENAILNYAKEINPVTIVMGTCGKSKKEVMGSVAAEVLDAGKYPVLTIPENITFNEIDKIKNVAFFCNLNQQDMLSLDAFSRIIGELPLNITVIPIEERKTLGNVDESLGSLISYCSDRYKYYKFVGKRILEKNFEIEFNEFVKNDNVDLILIPNKKKNIFARLFNPSVAHKMLFYADTPMLVMPI